MNTDGIYGKEFTYKDDLKPDEMAGIVGRAGVTARARLDAAAGGS